MARIQVIEINPALKTSVRAPDIYNVHVTEDFRQLEITSTEGFFAVLYKGLPFNIRYVKDARKEFAYHYNKTLFSSRQHAITMARKLNTQFGTASFTVVELEQGKNVPIPEKVEKVKRIYKKRLTK